MHSRKIITKGPALGEAEKVLVMLHGRGATARDILSLADHLQVKEHTLIAPEATNQTWYPFSFLVPSVQNEPWLSSALSLLAGIVQEILEKNIRPEAVYFAGFSQGACLTLEFAARNARRYGGIVAFTGGLIGDRIYQENYKGDFGGTPVFIGTSDPDPHIPVERVHATANILRNMKAAVTEKIYPDMGHTINQDEIDTANKIIFAR